MQDQENGQVVMDDDTVGVDEAATILEVHPNTVRNKMKKGLLPYHKVLTVNGEAYRIPRSALGAPVPTPRRGEGPTPSQALEVAPDGDRMVVALQDAVREAVMPLVAELNQTAQQLGTERERCREAEARIRELEGLLQTVQQPRKRGWWPW